MRERATRGGGVISVRRPSNSTFCALFSLDYRHYGLRVRIRMLFTSCMIVLVWIGSRGASLGVDSNQLNILTFEGMYRVPFFGGEGPCLAGARETGVATALSPFCECNLYITPSSALGLTKATGAEGG